jgi:hypothetical protein
VIGLTATAADISGAIIRDRRSTPALALGPCFAPADSLESNGIAEAFVGTFERDYVRLSPMPDGIRICCNVYPPQSNAYSRILRFKKGAEIYRN